MALSTLIVPVLLTFTACFALGKRVDVYSALTKGAEEGLTVLLHILPSLIALLSAVYMFRASGAMEALGALLAPALDKIGIPAETAPLLFIRPISGSGALAVGSEIMDSYGVDSYVGRVAAVMLGSSETTFYTVAVYYGAAGITKTRYTIPAALCADAVMFLASAFLCGYSWARKKEPPQAAPFPLFFCSHADAQGAFSSLPADSNCIVQGQHPAVLVELPLDRLRLHCDRQGSVGHGIE